MPAFNYQPIILTEAAVLRAEQEKIINEEFSYESFMTWATRKAKGYSVAEIDHLARRVVEIKTHEEKTDCIERIRDAITAATKKLTDHKAKADSKNVEDKNKTEYLNEHLEILRVMLGRAQAFNIVAHLDAEKAKANPAPPTGDKKHVIGHNT